MQKYSRSIRRVFLLSLLLGFVVSIPKPLDKIDHRGIATTVTFKVHKMNPPFAAFEDSHDSISTDDVDTFFQDDEASLGLTDRKILLVSGESFDINKLKEPQVFGGNLAQVDTKDRLSGIVIPKVKIGPANKVANYNGSHRLIKPATVRRPAQLYNSSGHLKSVRARKLELARQYSAVFADEPEDVIKEKARRKALIAAGAQQARVAEGERTIKSSTGSNIIIKKPKTYASQTKKEKQPSLAKDSQQESPKIDFARLIRKHSVSEDANNEIGIAGIDTDKELSYVVSGDLEIRDGLAFTGVDTFLKVVHIQGGYLRNEGVVWASEARFEIVVDHLEGYLIGELRASDGELLGYAELELGSVKPDNKKDGKIAGLSLVIRSAPKGLMVDVSSARSFDDNEIKVNDVELTIESLERKVVQNRKGEYKDSSLSADSSFILRGKKEGFWGSIAVRQAQGHEKLVMFPDSMMEALISLNVNSSNIGDANEYGVVWGRVLDGGHSVAGARVEMVGSGYVGPIYFTHFLPDKSRDKTSKNGLFAFVKVTPGIQSIRVSSPGKQFLAEIFPVAERHVSQIDVKTLKTRKATVSFYDGFEGQPLAGALKVIGSSREIDVPKIKQKKVILPGGSGVMLIEGDVGSPYEVVRITTKKSAYHIDFPFVKKSWLEELVKRAGVEVDKAKGMAVGFTALGARDVFLDEGYGSTSSQVIYFDQQGSFVEQSKADQSAGFVFVNVPVGYRTLTTHSNELQITSTQVIITAPGVVNIATFQE